MRRMQSGLMISMGSDDKSMPSISNIVRSTGCCGPSANSDTSGGDTMVARVNVLGTAPSSDTPSSDTQRNIDCLIRDILEKERSYANPGETDKESLSRICSQYLHADVLALEVIASSDSLAFLLEPWLRWVAQYESFDKMESEILEMFKHDGNKEIPKHHHPRKLLLDSHTPDTYRWFTASVAAENRHEKMVLELIDNLHPFTAERKHSDSWLYIIWRFLVGIGHNETKGNGRWTFFPRTFRSYMDNWTFLHFAAACGDLNCVEELVGKENVDVEENKENVKVEDVTTDRHKYTPLHLACYHDNASIVKLLLKKCADQVSKGDSRGRTPLHYACERGCLDSVKALLKHQDVIVSKILEAKDRDGMTPLQLAACRGQREVVSELLSKSGKLSVLVQACGRNVTHQKLFINRLLWQRQEQVWPRFDLNKAEIESCFAPNAYFLEPNPIRSQIWCPQGFTALHLAIVYRHVDIARQILHHGKKHAKVLLASKDALGLTPLDWAKAMEVDLLPTSRMGIKHWVEDDSSSDEDEGNSGSKGKGVERESILVMPINFVKAKMHYREVKEAEQEIMKVEWTIHISEALLARKWDEARWITSQGVEDQIKIEGGVWDHLERAMSYVLDFDHTREYRRSLIQGMLVELVKGKAFSDSSSTMQKCLLWAIKQEMVDVVKVIVRDTSKTCDLLKLESAVKISEDVSNALDRPLAELAAADNTSSSTRQSMKRKLSPSKPPLEAACEVKGERGAEMVATIEEQENVKKLLYEERKVYVEYSNTILVGAVLVAALAFQGWVQTAQGYPGMPLETTTKGMRLFARCNSLGFFFGMGAVMAGAVGAMPLRSGQLVQYKEKVIQAASVASLLMGLSVVCEVVGFSSAIVSVRSHRRDMLLSSRFGTVLIFLLSAWFLARLNNLRNVLSLLLEALPNTFLKFVTGMLAFWRILPEFRTFKRWVVYPLYVRVLAPHAPTATALVQEHCQLIWRFKTTIEALPESLERRLDKLNRHLDEIENQYHKSDQGDKLRMDEHRILINRPEVG